jgi:hypothetical protein
MSYYQKLNLPLNPFKDWPTVYQQTVEALPPGNNSLQKHIIRDTDILTDELKDILESNDIHAKHVVLFCSGNSMSNSATRVIHSDLTWDETAKSWKNYHCGINWELGTGTSNTIHWWDMSGHKPVYPFMAPYKGVDANGLILNKDAAVLNGIHYDARLQKGVHEHAVKLGEVTQSATGGPILVRTDTPHSTVYLSPKIRVGVSVRIDETSIDSWDKALKLFAPLITAQ